MFFFGENSTRRFDDFRPEVHDSDGLLLHFASGEWLWRPLDNPPRIDVSSFARCATRAASACCSATATSPSYQDIETRSELRPSAWVEPRGDWGDGHVELVEIPTDHRAERQHRRLLGAATRRRKPGKPARLCVHACPGTATIRSRPPGGRVVATRRDHGTVPGGHRFVIDFDGERAADAPAPTSRPPPW